MQDNTAYMQLKHEIGPNAKLVAVSKTKPVEEIMRLYDQGQRDFGENYVQELVEKEAALPKDICWHFIGHLQTNKVKLIAPFVHLIHAVDSLKLLEEINRQAENHNRTIGVLLQLHIAAEESKHGLDAGGLRELAAHCQNNRKSLSCIRICGLMGMATFTDKADQVRNEFRTLRAMFGELKSGIFQDDAGFSIISMGMSGDYKIALDEGSNMLRIGSLLFGARA